MVPRQLQAWIAAVTLTVAAACRQEAPPRLADGARSLEGLATAYVRAVVAGDTAGMHALRVTEQEHNELLWPEFPASRPELNMPVDFAWYNIDSRSTANAASLAERYRGRSLLLASVDCRTGVREYQTFRVHGDCWLTLEDRGRGERFEDKLFGSVVEMDGRFKIIGIVVE